MLQKLRNLLFFSDLPRSELKVIRPQIREENEKFCMIWSVIHMLFWTYCLIMSFSGNVLYQRCRLIYAVSLGIVTAAFFLILNAAPKHRWLVKAIVVVLDEVLLLAGILIAEHLAPQTIVVFAAVLIVPVKFVVETMVSVVMLLVNILVFILIGPRSMAPETYSWVLSNLGIFSLIGLMLGHFVNRARYERYLFAESKAQLADMQARYARYDQMTELQNRRAFEEKIDQLSKALPAGCRVVSADVNGLKETNDSLGHLAGDELITGAAECLRRGFEGIDGIYRIGGDEFAVIIPDEGYDLDGALERLKKTGAEWRTGQIRSISISTGVASADEFDTIGEILRAADSRMYESKRRYYESTGRDRRRRASDARR